MDANESKQDAPRPRNKRWYDKQQTVSKSVRLLETFPIEYQEILGDTMIRLAVKHCHAEKIIADLRALEPEKVLSIFKAKSKNRSYDKNETVHKAMNYMYVLPDDGRIFIAKQVIVVAGHLFEYFIICRETGQPTTREVAQSLCTAFVRGQLQSTEDHLARFCPSMTLPNGPTMQSIRARIAQAKAKAYQEEMTYLRENGIISTRGLATAKAPADITARVKQEESAQAEPASTIQPVEKAAPPDPIASSRAATEAPAATIPEIKPDTIKDETLAQDNRGMKIKLDKFDL